MTDPTTPPAAPEKPKTVKLTIDGKPAEVPVGTNLIEAARSVGVDIPYYCYHPKLSIAASCRICLVEASNAPKLVPACQTPAAEGTTVQTRSAKVKELQRSVLELLLLSHPVDCPICDQAGECKLQDYYMRYDFKPSRLEGGKVLKNKRKPLSPTVVLDQERCILCTRCVRFMREKAKAPVLGVFGRGSHEVIDLAPGATLDSNYSGNIVDICPVGALLSRDFRFKARAFFLMATPSICAGCARGCAVFLDHFNGHTYRVRPRENAKVNDVWMCDHGRFSYPPLEVNRALQAYVGRTREGVTAKPDDAVRLCAEKLAPIAGTDGLAFAASQVASLEDLLAAFKLAREGLGIRKVYTIGRSPGAADSWLLREDRNPNRRGLELAAKAFGLAVEPFDTLARAVDEGKVKALYAVGGEFPGDQAFDASVLHPLELVVVQSASLGPAPGKAHFMFPAAPHSEDDGTFVNADGLPQRFMRAYPPRGNSRPHWAWAAALLTALGRPVAWKRSRDVFSELAPLVPELAGFRWDDVPRFVKLKRFGVAGMPAAADGRPEGYRERSVT